MTRRERLENKVAKREEWADKRHAKAQAVYAFTEQFHGDNAFNTQPGHIPLRARVIRMEDRAHEDAQMATHHESKAVGLADQLDRTIFSDDDMAVEALTQRIADHEATRERMKLINRLYKKQDAAGLAALGLDLAQITAKLSEAGAYWGTAPHLPYEMSNLGGRIQADRKRLESITAQQARHAQATAAGGLLVEYEAGQRFETDDTPEGPRGRHVQEPQKYIRLTFDEKPTRAILDALKAAGFWWGVGRWTGETAKLPAEVATLLQKEN